MQYMTHKLHSNFVNSMSNMILVKCWYVKQKANEVKYRVYFIECGEKIGMFHDS